MAVGEVGSAISQRLMLPRDLHLPWIVACRAWKSRGHLSAMGAAAARPVLPEMARSGTFWQGHGSKGMPHGDGKCLGRGRHSSAPKQVSSKAEQVFRQCVSSQLWVGFAWSVTCVSSHIPGLPLAPAPGIGPLGAGEQRLHSSAQFLQESPRDFFYPFWAVSFG